MKPPRVLPSGLALFALLAPSILASYTWSLVPSTAWLLAALGALGLGIGFVALGATLWPHAWQRRAWMLVGALTLALYQLARALSFYFQGEGFNDRFLFHFNLNTLAEAGPAYVPQMLAAAAWLLAVALAALLLAPAHVLRRTRALPPALALVLFCLLDPGVRVAFGGGVQSLARFPIEVPDDIPWAALGLDPRALRAAPDMPLEGGRNLLFIYLEGLEHVYTEESAFPGLTPNLARLAAGALRAEGLVQTEGTSWTAAALLASQCGTPLLHDFGGGGNDTLQNGFLNRAVCLGDVLASAGYRQVFMGGASTNFAGKGTFLAAHGYDEVLGREELAPLLDDPGYLSGWGLYDDSLFTLAERRFAELAAGDAPFNLTLLTLDTHHPEGHPSASCPRYPAMDNSILHAVHCTDHLLGAFIERLEEHPAWRDTVVVLMSDHLAMRNVAQRFYPSGYERRPLFLVLNAGAGELREQASHMDVAPTVLDLLGVNTDVGFLAGRSLLRAASPAAVDLDAPARLQAIRYVNTALLTGRAAGLCEERPMIAPDGNGIRLGAWRAMLSEAGAPLPLDALGEGHVVVAALEAAGKIASLATIDAVNLPHVLYTVRDSAVLLIGPAARLPAAAPANAPETGVVALLGNPRGGFTLLGQAETAGDLVVEGVDCLAQVRAASRPGSAADADLLAAMCADGGAAGHLEGDALRLPRVMIETAWYEAVLDGSAAEGFTLRERRPLDEPPAAPACHAWFGNGRLIVPKVEGAEGISALTMRMVPGTQGVFETVRVF